MHAISGTPAKLIPALTRRGREAGLKGVRIAHLLALADCEYAAPGLEDTFRVNSWFTGESVRSAIADGRADYTPVNLSECPSLMAKGIIKPDVALVQVTPADERGFHSMGPSIDTSYAGVKYAKHLIGQVNPRFPRTYGDTMIHGSHFDALVLGEQEVPEVQPKKLTDVDRKIGSLIAEQLVEDGATMQMGIGGIPDAVLAACAHHKNLGVFSEMFSDGVLDLLAQGVITNSEKKIEPGRLTATFLLGSKRLYTWAHDNPILSMRVADFVNNAFNIVQNPKVTAINSCTEIDVVGNVSADTIGSRVYSGIGGQLDFLRGAACSLDGRGKPILAISSTTNKGESKIKSVLPLGAHVTTTRAHVHYVVTEYGIANLFGRSLRQRAYEMIQIAHPSHRQQLERDAYARLKCMPSKD